MQTRWIAVGALAACLFGTGAPAQVRVVVDGQVQDVPAGVTRIIAWSPGGRQVIRDEPFAGQVAPGGATITNVETVTEDGAGRVIGTRIVTRIVPMRAIAGAQITPRPAFTPPPPPAPSPRLQPALASAAADPLDRPGEGMRRPAALRIGRDPTTGHFIMPIRINGVEIRAIVDTGAANTILSPDDARATGAAGEIVDTQRMVGVGGYTMLNIARVRSLEVAGQDLGGLSTPVGQEGLGYTLLGQSEIARLGRIVIEDGMMTITPRPIQITSR